MANSKRKTWSTSGIDIFLDLEHAHGRGLRVRLENSLRDAIRDGLLPRGTRLPPTRALATDLGISRGTIMQAYAQLVAEGWIAGRSGAETVVVFDHEAENAVLRLREPPPLRWRFDLRPGRPDSSSFPRTEWLRALRRALATSADEAFGYGSARGQLAVRTELASYLGRARGLRVGADNLLVSTGFTQSLGLVSRALAAAGVSRIAMEEPSMPLHRSIVRAAGHELVPLGIDGDGARVEELEKERDIGAVVLTPNRQHPTGVSLSAPRRSRLLEWARETGAFVIEDDYDGEFRYDSHPLGPLQGLDPDAVVYAGTASKTLAPGVRLGWLALPEQLQSRVEHEKELADWNSAALEQLAFAELLRSSAYDRHVRKMRLRYRHRRDLLASALGRAIPDLELTGLAAGLNLLVPLPTAALEAKVIAAAGAAGIGVDGLDFGGYYERPGPAGLIIGYAAPPEHVFRRAAEALTGVLADALS